MGESKLVNFQLDESRKRTWEEAAESNSRSLSGFIRYCVETKIAEDETSSEGISDGVSERVSEVLDSNRNIASQLVDMNDRLKVIEREIRTDEDIQRLATEVFSILPNGLEGTIAVPSSPDELPPLQQGPNGEITGDNYGTIERIAAVLDENELRVRRAIEKLQNDTHLIRSVTRGDEQRFYKED